MITTAKFSQINFKLLPLWIQIMHDDFSLVDQIGSIASFFAPKKAKERTGVGHKPT